LAQYGHPVSEIMAVKSFIAESLGLDRVCIFLRNLKIDFNRNCCGRES